MVSAGRSEPAVNRPIPSETYRMTCRITRWIALVALLAVLPFAGQPRLAAQTSAPRFILCAPASAVAGIALRHGLTVVRPLDQHAHDIFLVNGPTGVATADLLATVRADAAVTNFEPDSTRSLTEAKSGVGLNQSTVAILDQSTVAILDQSTVAILDALTDTSLVPFDDLEVWTGYVNQPAASILRLPETHAQFGTGSAIVALIDEGVDPTHPLLAPALVPGYDFIRNLPGYASEWTDLDQKLLSTLNQSTVAILDQSTVAILDGSTPAVLNQSTVAILDQSTVAILDTTQVPSAFGHGSMMAGAIRRVAPTARIMPLKAFRATGTANLFDVIRAIYFAAENGAGVIAMGFGMPESSVELTHAINFATSRGVLVVAAAGNDGREVVVFPAALRSVIGVGSTSPTDQRSTFSNFGDALVKVAAPGESIITSYPGGRYAAASGTSFSAALVSGAAALLRHVDPAITPAAALEAIGKGAVKTNTMKLGAGRVDVFEVLRSRTGTVSPPPATSSNQAPVATNDMVSVAEDTAITVDVRLNDQDADNDALAVTAVTTPSNGTAVLGTTSSEANAITYRPRANFVGIDSFTYTVSDGRATATAAVTVTVTGRNDVPVATADTVTTQEDTAVTVDVVANDTDGDGEALSVVAVGGASRGTASLVTAGPDAGRIRYVPNSNVVGIDSFSYTVGDARNGTAVATVTVTISDVNDAPVAVNDAASGPEESLVVINVAANDSDADGDALTVSSVTQAANGAVTLLTDGATAGSISYRPTANFTGTETFAYTIADGAGASAVGTVTVTVTGVNDAPAATNDVAAGQEDAALVVDVTANDSDLDGDTLTVTEVGQPATGTAAIAPSGANAGKVTYIPGANFSGSDTFNYTIADGNGGTASAQVSITIASVNDAPVAIDDTAATPEDTSLVIAVSANDTDVDSDRVAVTSVTQPAHGTAAIVPDGADAGAVSYTPTPNFAGTDSFTYGIADGNGGTATANVTVTVTSVNDGPVAADDVATGPEDAVLVIDVAANDSDADRERLCVTAVTQPQHGAVALIPEGSNAGSLSYTPGANFAGTDRFTYTIADGSGESATAAVVVTVTGLNDGPAAVDDSATTNEDTPVTVPAIANDADADGDDLTVGGVGTPAHGTAVIVAGEVVYTPAANFAGTDSFTYTVTDGNGGTATARVAVTVTAVDDLPVAVNDVATGPEDAPIVVHVVGNDTDPDGSPLRVASVTQPAHGVATLLTEGADAGSVRYTPAANFAGTDSFTYTVTDGTDGTATGTVALTVTALNDQPAAADDMATTAEDTAAMIQPLANDADPDGDALAISAVGVPANGVAAVTGTAVTYTPAPNFAGTDTFTYTTADAHGGSATATITVSVTAVDDVPVAANDVATGPEDAVLVIDVAANDRDPDGSRLHVTALTQPAHGSVTVLGDGTDAGSLSYAPAGNFAGTDSFTYTITDGNGGVATGTVAVTITPLNDQPSAGDDTATTPEDVPLVVQALTNDADPDGDSLVITAVSTPAHGSAVLAGGVVTYTPASNYAGPDSFTYSIADGNGGTATATVSITVSSVDDAPVAADDVATAVEDTAIVVDVAANDSDADGSSMQVTSVTQPAHGSVSVITDGADAGSVRYVPAPNYSGADRFTYTISDGSGAGGTATVVLTVTPVNDGPSAADDSATTTEDVPLTIQPVGNDADPDGDALAVTAVSAPAHGVVVLAAGGVTYTPAADFAGIDSFTYTVADAKGETATATVSITVEAVADAPIASDDAAVGPEDAIVVVDVVANDSDADGSSLRLANVTQPAHGLVTMLTDGVNAGKVSYSPAANFAGTDRFTYIVADGSGQTATGTVVVTITALNDVPAAADDAATTSEDTSVAIRVVANDSDPDGDALTLSEVSAPAFGTASIAGSGEIVYTPHQDFAGTDRMTYIVTDANGGTASASIEITVIAANDPPAATDDVAVVAGDGGPTQIDVLGNDSTAPDAGESLAILAVGVATGGSVTIEGATLGYTPSAGFSGTDRFTYTIGDGHGGTATATVIVTVVVP